MSDSVSWIESHDTKGMATLDFVAQRTAKRNVTGAVWIPDDPNPDVPLMLFGHGASGDRYQTPIPELAQRFVEDLRCPVLSLDGPVHGLRAVEPGGRQALFAELRRAEAVADMVEEWHFGVELAFSRDDIGPRSLSYFGLSMGSVFGIPLLAERDDVIVSTIGLIGTTGATSNLREKLMEAASKLTHPVFCIMQLEDELFPRDGYLELFDSIGSEDKRLHANPGLHPEVPLEELLFSFEFMKGHIEGTASKRIVNPLAE